VRLAGVKRSGPSVELADVTRQSSADRNAAFDGQELAPGGTLSTTIIRMFDDGPGRAGISCCLKSSLRNGD
jgi:hypothetical protein